MPIAPPRVSLPTFPRKRQTRREAGTQSHGSGHSPDGRVTEGMGLRRAPRERGFLRERRLSMSRGSTARELRGELALTHIAVCVTVVASVLSLGGILLSLVEDVASGRWVSSLGQGLFLAIVSFLIYGGLVYQFARLGHFNRLRQHRRATEDELDRFFHTPRPSALTILVPSYKEDPLVVRRTLLSAALQDYPWRRGGLLIDGPPHPSQASDIPLLTAARGLAAEIQETLRKPREHFEDALRAFLERSARGPLDPHQEMPRLAQLYRDAATWFEHQGARY